MTRAQPAPGSAWIAKSPIMPLPMTTAAFPARAVETPAAGNRGIERDPLPHARVADGGAGLGDFAGRFVSHHQGRDAPAGRRA